jgi:hypothetical protein
MVTNLMRLHLVFPSPVCDAVPGSSERSAPAASLAATPPRPVVSIAAAEVVGGTNHFFEEWDTPYGIPPVDRSRMS